MQGFCRYIMGMVCLSIGLLFGQLSPGLLHQSHSQLEGLKNCTQCHDRGKQISAEKCLSCHTILKAEIAANTTIHAGPEYRQCQACHVEHHGRDYTLVYWEKGRENFDHRKTGFALEGRHARLSCRDCHRDKYVQNPDTYRRKDKDVNRSFLGLSGDCLACHRDEHRGQLGADCLQCHDMNGWFGASKFDHGRTAFPLTGKHRAVVCEKCHEPRRDRALPDDPDYTQYTGLDYQRCQACHADIHQGQLGQDCQKCHSTTGWHTVDREEFDHDLTAFPLMGKHQSIDCEKCHKTEATWKISTYQYCRDCHDDYHQGQFGQRAVGGECSECHREEGYVPAIFTINQHQQSLFPLTAAHLAVPCIACHQKINAGTPLETIQFRFQSTDCQTCHDSPHGKDIEPYLKKKSGSTGKTNCEYCHTTERWDQVTFEHDLTDFSLTGTHQSVSCVECHKANVEKSEKHIPFAGLSGKCQDCHIDVHQGQFAQSRKAGTDCFRCHTTKNWQPEKFEHNRDSRFRLDGAHVSLACGDCHKTEQKDEIDFIRYKPIDPACKTCH